MAALANINGLLCRPAAREHDPLFNFRAENRRVGKIWGCFYDSLCIARNSFHGGRDSCQRRKQQFGKKDGWNILEP